MTVLNKHKLPGKDIPPGAIYIGRGSQWGNPYVIGNHGNRDDVVDQYEEYLVNRLRHREWTAQDLATLHGKDLVCFCAPLRCHGDVLERYAKSAFEFINKTKE